MNTVPYPKEPKTDPLVRAIKKARNESAWGQLQKLLIKRSKFQAKITRAEGVLDEINEDIKNFARQLAREADAAGTKGDVLRRFYDGVREQVRKDALAQIQLADPKRQGYVKTVTEK